MALMVHEWMTCQHWQVFSPYLAVLVIASLSPHPQYNIDFSLSNVTVVAVQYCFFPQWEYPVLLPLMVRLGYWSCMGIYFTQK